MKNERLDYDIEINEGETPVISINGKDALDVNITTAIINYIYLKIDDYFSDTVIKANTNLGNTANPVSYTLLEAETRIVNNERPFEYRIVTFDFVYSTTKHITDEYVIKIVNLKYH